MFCGINISLLHMAPTAPEIHLLGCCCSQHTLPEPCYIYVLITIWNFMASTVCQFFLFDYCPFDMVVLCPVVFICWSIFLSPFFPFFFVFSFIKLSQSMFAQPTRQMLLLPINVTHSEITMSGNVTTTKMNHRSSYSFFPELPAAPPGLHQHQFTLGCIQMSRRLFAEAFTGSPWEPRGLSKPSIYSVHEGPQVDFVQTSRGSSII